jgi:hypothetical protein
MFKPSMEKDNIASGMSVSLTAEPSFPADFAQRVLLTARQKARRRRLRNRIAAAAAVLLIVSSILLAVLTRPRETLTFRDTGDVAKRGWQVRWNEDALAYQLAQGTDPRSAGDYLLPNAGALIGLSSGYSEASWQYDPPWS